MNQSIEKKKRPFWMRHFLKLFLFLALLISLAWGYWNQKQLRSDYSKQTEQLKLSCQKKIDSLKNNQIKMLSNTLALAVRDAMIDNNLNQVKMYFKQTLKTFDVQKIMLVNQNSGKVLTSTDLKDLEQKFSHTKLLQAKQAMSLSSDNHQFAAAPIMGLNTQLAVLIIQIN